MSDHESMDWEAAYADGRVESPLDHHVLELAPTLTPGRALDVGCGAGQNSIWLAEQGWAVTGVDIAPSAIDAAIGAAEVAGVDATFVVADTRRWTTVDTYDFVFSTYALPAKGPGRTHALAVAAGAVAPGGVLLVAEFDVSLGTGTAWSESDLTDTEELKAHLGGFKTLRLDVEQTRHAHGHDEQHYPVVVAIARNIS